MNIFFNGVQAVLSEIEVGHVRGFFVKRRRRGHCFRKPERQRNEEAAACGFLFGATNGATFCSVFEQAIKAEFSEVLFAISTLKIAIHRNSIPPRFLGPIERLVGFLNQGLFVLRFVFGQGDADAQGD